MSRQEQRHRIILALERKDCASKKRIIYHLPEPLDAEFLRLFHRAEIRIDRFSEILSGARDHFSITFANMAFATGVIGEKSLVFTVWEPHLQEAREIIDSVERVLMQRFSCQVDRRKTTSTAHLQSSY